MTSFQTDQIAAAFRTRTLPNKEWTHEAHLRVGLWHLLHYPPAEAMDQLCAGISSYNLACGVANTDSSGYHETITQLYLILIANFLAQHDRMHPIDQLADDLLQTLGDQQTPFHYYTKETLFSTEARQAWVEPDLCKLPTMPHQT